MGSRNTSQRITSLMLALTVMTSSLHLFAQSPIITLPIQPPVTDGPTSGDGIATENDPEPIIRLPALPPRRNFPDGQTTTPGNGGPITIGPIGPGGKPIFPGGFPGGFPGSSSGLTPPAITKKIMLGMERSAFPQMTCALIDNRPYKDLVTAITNLTNVVKPVGECQNNTDLTKMTEESLRLREAGVSLQKIWDSPQDLTDDPKKIMDFQNSLLQVVTGLNRITENFQNSSLINSKCGKETLTTGGVVVALGDLVSSLAPIALVGASLAGAPVAALLPYAMGVTAAGSVVKIMMNMHDRNNLEMWRPEQRLAVLQNICEFSKISTRVRYIKRTQKKDVADVSKDLNERKFLAMDSLKEYFPERVFKIVKIRKEYQEHLEQAKHVLALSRADYLEQKEVAKENTDDDVMCGVATSIRETITDTTVYPTSTVNNLKKLTEIQTRMMPAQRAILNREDRIRKVLLSKSVEDLESNTAECAKLGRSYFSAISSVMSETDKSIQRLSTALEKQLYKDPDYAVYRITETQMLAEVETIQRVSDLMLRMNADNAIIDRIEMDMQMRDLKRSLFSSPSGLPFIGGESPAMSWLSYTQKQYDLAIKQFKIEMKDLIGEAFRITSSNQSASYVQYPWGAPVRDQKTGLPIPIVNLNNPQEFEKFMADRRSASTLQNITPAMYKDPDSATQERKRRVCQRLENTWFAWSSTMDHLAAQSFFCRNIREHFDANTETALKRRCENNEDLNGKVAKPSEIVKASQDLIEKGYRDQALIVSAKLDELGCEMPDASVMK